MRCHVSEKSTVYGMSPRIGETQFSAQFSASVHNWYCKTGIVCHHMRVVRNNFAIYAWHYIPTTLWTNLRSNYVYTGVRFAAMFKYGTL